MRHAIGSQAPISVRYEQDTNGHYGEHGALRVRSGIELRTPRELWSKSSPSRHVKSTLGGSVNLMLAQEISAMPTMMGTMPASVHKATNRQRTGGKVSKRAWQITARQVRGSGLRTSRVYNYVAVVTHQQAGAGGSVTRSPETGNVEGGGEEGAGGG